MKKKRHNRSFPNRLCALMLTGALTLSLAGCGAKEVPVGVCGCADPAAFTAGDGSAENPYEIRTAEQLRHAECHSAQHLALKADIALEDAAWTPLCGESGFSGSLCGEGHTISGLIIVPSGTAQGLFAQIAPQGSVSDLALEGSITVSDAGTLVGSVAGSSLGAVSNVSSQMQITVEASAGETAAVGGLVGNNSGTVRECAYTGTLTDLRATPSAGAMIGHNAVAAPEGLVEMVTAHAGFGPGSGYDNQDEWDNLDVIIAGLNIGPDFAEVDVAPITEEDGTIRLGVGHGVVYAKSSGVLLQDIFDLMLGRHPRSGELNEDAFNVRLQIDCKLDGMLPSVLEAAKDAGYPIEKLSIVGRSSYEHITECRDMINEAIDQGLDFRVDSDLLMDYLDMLKDVDAFVEKAKSLELHETIFSIRHVYVTQDLVARLAAEDIFVSAWTPSQPKDLEDCLTIGLYSVTTRSADAITMRDELRYGTANNSFDDSWPEIGAS